jgi:hypothetical protein
LEVGRAPRIINVGNHRYQSVQWVRRLMSECARLEKILMLAFEFGRLLMEAGSLRRVEEITSPV